VSKKVILTLGFNGNSSWKTSAIDTSKGNPSERKIVKGLLASVQTLSLPQLSFTIVIYRVSYIKFV